MDSSVNLLGRRSSSTCENAKENLPGLLSRPSRNLRAFRVRRSASGLALLDLDRASRVHRLLLGQGERQHAVLELGAGGLGVDGLRELVGGLVLALGFGL